MLCFKGSKNVQRCKRKVQAKLGRPIYYQTDILWMSNEVDGLRCKSFHWANQHGSIEEIPRLRWYSQSTMSGMVVNYVISLPRFDIKIRDNYSKPTWGLVRLRFAYPWFKTLYIAHLRLLSLGLYCPPPLKRRVKVYFCTIFISLSSQNIKHIKIQ